MSVRQSLFVRRYATPIATMVLIAVFVSLLYWHTQKHRAWIVRADSLCAHGDLTGAIELYKKAHKYRPGDQSILEKIASIAEQAGDPDSAAWAIELLLAADPGNTELRFRLAHDYLWAKNYRKVIELLEPLTKAGKADIRLQVDLVHAYAQTGQAEKIKPLVDKILAKDTTSPRLTKELIEGLLKAGDQEGAIEAYSRLPAHMLDNMNIRRRLAELLRAAERHKQAKPVYEELAKQSPRDIQLIIATAEVEAWAGMPDVAVHYLESILPQEPNNEEILKRLAKYSFQAKEYAKTVTYMARRSELRYPLSRQDRLRWAKALELTGKNQAAVRVLRKLLSENPDDVDTLASLTGVYLADHNYPAAVKMLNTLIQLQPTSLKWRMTLARTLIADNKNEEAYKQLQTITRTWPDNAQAKRLLADAALWTERYAEALVAYERMIQAGDKSAAMYRNAAQAAMGAGDTEKAKEYTHQLATMERLDDVMKFRLAQSLNAIQDYRQAELLLRELVQANPKSPKYLSALLDAQIGNKDFRSAIATCKNLLAIKPDDAAIEERLADLYTWNHEYTKAAELYRKQLQGNESNQTLRRKLADALLWSKDFSSAKTLFEELYKLNPDNHEIRTRLIDACMGSKDYSRAATLLQKSLQEQPGDVKAESLLAMALYLDGQLEEAEQHLNVALKADPDNIRLIRFLADIAMEQQRYDEAVRLFRKAIALGDQRRDTLLHLARTLSWKRGYDQALQVYNRLIQTYPNDWRIQREKARILGWEKRYDESLREYRNIIQAHPNNLPLETEYQAKKAFYNRRDKTAINQYKKLIDLEPDNIEAWFDLGQVYSRHRVWADARKVYQELLDLYPAHPQARVVQDKIKAIRNRTEVEPRFTFDRQKSESWHIDVKKYDGGIKMGRWLTDQTKLTGEEHYEAYRFPHAPLGQANVFRLDLLHVSGLDWNGEIGLGIRNFITSGDCQLLPRAKMQFDVLDVGDLTFQYQRDNFVENQYTYDRKMMRDEASVLSEWRVTRQFRLNGGYNFRYLSDSNHRNLVQGGALYEIFPDPVRLDVGYRMEWWSYRKNTDEYYSPTDVTFNSFYVDFRHTLNQNELFWGANDLYYELGYQFTVDSNQETGHTIKAGLHYDVSNTVSLHADYQKTMGTTYQRDLVMTYLRWLF